MFLNELIKNHQRRSGHNDYGILEQIGEVLLIQCVLCHTGSHIVDVEAVQNQNLSQHQLQRELALGAQIHQRAKVGIPVAYGEHQRQHRDHRFAQGKGAPEEGFAMAASVDHG